MRSHRLGRTGLDVSVVSLGTVELGLDYGIRRDGECLRPNESVAAELLNVALDSGVNLIDTARAYGSAESIIGRAIGHRRGEYFLVSKVKPQPGRRARVAQLVEESLRELHTDYIDIMMMHCGEDALEPDATTIEALDELRGQGKIRFLGSSVYGEPSAMAAIQSGFIHCVEIAWNLLDRRPETHVVEAASKNGVGVIVRSVLLKGALTSRYRLLSEKLSPLKHAIEQLAEIAGSVDALPALAYRYILTHAEAHTALIGTACQKELKAAIDYAERGPLDACTIAAIHRVELKEQRWLNAGEWPA